MRNGRVDGSVGKIRMNIATLIKRNIAYHWKTHLSLFLGAVLASAMLIGALIVGDSVRESLKQMTLKRLGKTLYGIEFKEGFVRAELAKELETIIQTPVVPLLRLPGIITLEGGALRLPGITVYGINDKFAALAHRADALGALEKGEGFINRRLADKLGLKPGDSFQIRIQDQSLIPLAIPFSDNRGNTKSIKVRVKSILDSGLLGDFSLRIHQVPPFNLFLPAQDLYSTLSLSGKVNIFLVPETNKNKISLERVNQSLKDIWQPRDIGIITEQYGDNVIRLRSEKIFIDPLIGAAGLKADPEASGVFTYFVNKITSGEGTTPYSFITAAGPPLVPEYLKANEIVINEWLAKDLNSRPGATIQLSYFIPGLDDRLEIEESGFIVKDIVPVDRGLMESSYIPPFPGLTNVSQCRNWDPGIPIDLDEIRKKDEDYWNTYREIPKAYISLEAAQKIWKNPFGNLTAIHYPGDKKTIDAINDFLRHEIDPSGFGLEFLPLREAGLLAGEHSVDFGGLFIGLSFFIIMAALLLMSLFISIEKDYRSYEWGLLRSLGFSRKSVLKLFLIETLIIIMTGNLVGIVAGILYNQGVLLGLNTIWKGAVGTSSLTLSILPSTLGMGFLLSLGVTAGVIVFAAAKSFSLSAITLTRTKGIELQSMKTSRVPVSMILFLVCMIPVVIMFFLSVNHMLEITSTYFFLSGILLLVGSISLYDGLLSFSLKGRKEKKPGLFRVGLNNLALRKKMSIVTVSLLAFGIFVIITVGVYQGKLPGDPDQRKSGTGGFRLFGETSLPIITQIKKSQIPDNVLFPLPDADDISFVFIKVQPGDDASCLNLNLVAFPRVLGLNPQEFARSGSFSFAEVHSPSFKDNPWLILDQKTGDGFIPVIADQTVIIWGLGKKVGDILSVRNEQGKIVRVKLVAGLENSIFQGNLIISNRFFKELYPSVSGYGMFLVDAPADAAESISNVLTERLKNLGVEIVYTKDRLAAFSEVENTYLTIFLILGGIGIFLGSLGFGIIVLRKMNQAKKEYAILRAVGFRRITLFVLIFSENIQLLFIGLICGCLSGVGAFLLFSISHAIKVAPFFILMILSGVFMSGIIWICGSTLSLLFSSFIPALRNE
ncbi:MAG: FtsX-like permease family protein [Spirochaetales bacterium]|nr:FtsX-like permease family protein [Spirochaetales bacterium]